jgi:hypothetical protein
MAAPGHNSGITDVDGKVTFPPGYDPDLDQDRAVSMDRDSSEDDADDS